MEVVNFRLEKEWQQESQTLTMGRKRKIPPGYSPRWNSDSDSSDFQEPSTPLHVPQFPDYSLSVSRIPSKISKSVQEHPSSTTQVDNSTASMEDDYTTKDEESVQEEWVQGEENQATDPATLSSDNSIIQEDPTFQVHEDLSDFTEPPDDLFFPAMLTEELRIEQEFPPEVNVPELPVPDAEFREVSSDEDEDEDEEEENPEDKLSFRYNFAKFSEAWVLAEVNHVVSKQASGALWNVARKWIFDLTTAFQRDKKKKFPKYDHMRRKLVHQKVPPVSMDFGYLHKDTKELTVVSESEKTPVKDFPPDTYEKVYEIASVKVTDFLAFS